VVVFGYLAAAVPAPRFIHGGRVHVVVGSPGTAAVGDGQQLDSMWGPLATPPREDSTVLRKTHCRWDAP